MVCKNCGRDPCACKVRGVIAQHDAQKALASQAHYTTGGIEPIDYIKAQGWFPDFACGNIVKYVTRYKLKNGVEDLHKARVYLDWLIEEEAKV